MIPAGNQYPTPEARALVYRKFLDSVRALPGVESAGAVDPLAFSGENHGGWVTASENEMMGPRNQLPAEIDVVSSDYLETMGVRLFEGRSFSEDDIGERPRRIRSAGKGRVPGGEN